jgi:predicted TIM-barrel fold metal-dependent hydrolase
MQGKPCKTVVMGKLGIISVDGHVKASRAGYRDFFDDGYRAVYDDSIRAAEESGTPDGFVRPAIGESAQWDPDRRLADLETQGVVAEVLIPNGIPLQDEPGLDPELRRQGRLAYNRWLADFCATAPDRWAGQAAIAFDDIDAAVQDLRWAKAHGLRGVMMPALEAGGIFFFDPVLDPVWAACEELELPITQHGGAGTPEYGPPGFAAIMTLATEHSFFSGRSLWQMILGGVFDRFPGLTVVFAETEAHWIGPAIDSIDRRLAMGDDWMEFAQFLQRERPFTRRARDYWESNCYAGISPFHPNQIDLADLGSTDEREPDEFRIRSDNAMFGVDYPHFESIFPDTRDQVANLVGEPSVTERDARKVLFDNAAAVYGFDADELQAHVDRVGFELDEVAAAPA